MAINPMLLNVISSLTGVPMGNMTQNQDLGKITVAGPQPQATQPAPQVAPQSTPQIPASAPKPQGNFDLKDLLLKVGVPGLAAVIGSTSKGTLPAMAGFAGGYTEAGKTQADREQELTLAGAKDVGPSPQSILKMAQTEAFRQMGGGMLGQAKMASDPKFKQEYLDLVERLYETYLEQFRGEVPNAIESSSKAGTTSEMDTEEAFANMDW